MIVWLNKGNVWHLWHAPPVTGDHSCCGLPKDDACLATGDPTLGVKCKGCERASRRSIPT